MANETVDFLVHEVDEHLAASVGQNFPYETEGSACPSERIDEGECRKEPAIAHETRVEPCEGGLEGDSAFDHDAEIRWQRAQRRPSDKLVEYASIAGHYGWHQVPLHGCPARLSANCCPPR